MAISVLIFALILSLKTICLCSTVNNNMEIEVHLSRLNNTFGKLADGTCCNGFSNFDGSCFGECNTYARVCISVLKALPDQLNRETCNVAYRVTELVGHNSINAGQSADIRVSNPPQNWKPNKSPFRVIVQLYHAPSGNSFRLPNDAYLIANGSTYEADYLPSQTWTSHRSWRPDGVEFVYSYRVRCAANYYGSSCQRLCVPRNDIVGHFYCNSEGQRVCLPGYSGLLCHKPICDNNCTSNGICVGPNSCRCLPGWTGADCSQCVPMPHCSPQHGFCRRPMECECKPGYGGMLCDIDLEWCRNNPNPCENGGRCVNKDGWGYNYTCLCPPGYAGFHCEKQLNDCRLTGCSNGGTCVLNSTGIPIISSLENALTTTDNVETRCQCPPGYTGRQCQFNVTKCSEGPCQGRGRCRDVQARPGGPGFLCECQPGWSGQNCEINTDDCKPGFCLNGGQCVDGLNKFHCVCRHHYRGPQCNVSLLDCRVRCLNGGVCNDRANSLECRCPPGFAGAFCEQASPGHPNRLGNRTDHRNLTSSASSATGIVELASSTSGGGGVVGSAETALFAVCGVLLPLIILLLCLLTASCRRYWRRRNAANANAPSLSSCTTSAFTTSTPTASTSKAKNDEEELEAGGGESEDQETVMSLNNIKKKNLLPTAAVEKEKLGYFAHKMVNNLHTGRSRASLASSGKSAASTLHQQHRQLLPSPPQHQLATVSGRLGPRIGADVSDRQMLLRSTSLPTPSPQPPTPHWQEEEQQQQQQQQRRALRFQESCPYDVVAYTEV